MAQGTYEQSHWAATGALNRHGSDGDSDLHWMLLYLSSRGSRVRRGQGAEQLAGDVVLQGAHDFLSRPTLGSTAGDVSAGRGIRSHADDSDGRERDSAGGRRRD